jgi:myo-inositol-1-phosphate synthase
MSHIKLRPSLTVLQKQKQNCTFAFQIPVLQTPSRKWKRRGDKDGIKCFIVGDDIKADVLPSLSSTKV